MASRSLILALLVLLPAASGCMSGRLSGTLRAESLGGDPVFVELEFTTSVYAGLNSTETSFFLTDIPLGNLLAGNVSTGTVVHLDLLWHPSAGETPIDSSATNVSIRYIVFAEGEVGVYGGAGFAMPKGTAGDTRMSLSLRDASLTLLDSTDGFIDLLSPARLTGKLTAVLDRHRSQRMAWAVNQMVTNALGYTRLVESSRPATRRRSSSSSSSSGA